MEETRTDNGLIRLGGEDLYTGRGAFRPAGAEGARVEKVRFVVYADPADSGWSGGHELYRSEPEACWVPKAAEEARAAFAALVEEDNEPWSSLAVEHNCGGRHTTRYEMVLVSEWTLRDEDGDDAGCETLELARAEAFLDADTAGRRWVDPGWSGWRTGGRHPGGGR